jgi:glycosyltransferase involved in cell wall biosynthesis
LIDAIRFFRKDRFDIIHVHWPFPHGIWGWAASWRSGAPMVISFHGAEILLCKRFAFVKHFLRHAIKHARAICCNSRYTASEVAKLSDRPVHVLPFGCTVEARPSVKEPHKPVKDVLFVGRLIARKGVDYLLKAIPLLDAKVPVHLHVVGDGHKAEEWKALARQLKLDGKVTFHGSVSDEELERQYARADVFVLPAIVDDYGDTEGLGVVLVEALCFKTPVVASAVGGIPDVIRDRETGLLVPERDSAALAEAIAAVLLDRPLAESLAECGLRYAQNYFSWQRITDQLIAIYREVLGESAGRDATGKPGGSPGPTPAA